MELSKRALEIQASPIRKLMPYAVAAKEKGIKVYHLNIGQPDIPTPPEMIKVYHEFSEKVLAYGPSQGLDVYQKGLVKYYLHQGLTLSVNDIIVTTAGSEAIIFAMMVVGEVGDEIIVPEPFYTNYNGFATMAGINLVPLTTYAETGFALPDDKHIEARISPKTKAVMLCNPGNPTGAVYSREELFRVAALCKKHLPAFCRLFLVSFPIRSSPDRAEPGIPLPCAQSSCLAGLRKHLRLIDPLWEGTTWPGQTSIRHPLKPCFCTQCSQSAHHKHYNAWKHYLP